MKNNYNDSIFSVKKYCIVALLVICVIQHAYTQNTPPQQTKVLFVLDASRSMLASWGSNSKMYAARQIIQNITDSLSNVPNMQTALRVFGHQTAMTEEDCEDSKLEVPFRANNAQKIKEKLSLIRPQGVTPISYALKQTINDFGPNRAETNNIIIIITDGFESCGEDLCDVVYELQKNNISLKSYIVGLGLEQKQSDKFQCVGEVDNIQYTSDINNVITKAMGKILNYTVAKVNLLDGYNKPTETDVVMTFYDSESNKAKENIYHTLNAKGDPDTMFLDPAFNYNLQIHTTPPVWKNNISITPDKLNVINELTPQGYLKVSVRGETFKGKINCVIKKDNDVIDAAITNTSQKLLIGQYNIEILTLPVILVNNIKVEQNKTTTIEVPSPGYVTFLKSGEIYGGIYIFDENKLVEIFELNENNLKETLALQPGKYKIIYRAKGSKAMKDSKETDFDVVSGTTISIKL